MNTMKIYQVNFHDLALAQRVLDQMPENLQKVETQALLNIAAHSLSNRRLAYAIMIAVNKNIHKLLNDN